MNAALDLGVNVVIFTTLLSLAIWLFTIREDPVSKKGAVQNGCEQLVQEGQRLVGTVQRFSERNGYGFISCASCRAAHGRDVQLFQEDWEALQLKIGAVVSFELSFKERYPCPKGRPWATSIQVE
ncbi:unnamed protein product [Effrenium voratum]|uniref:Uncharacterized protein n=1 Tax=Effrenium voratum TaxID=2562239 RepID=A0AA36HPE6_9DINO|nr:unnamed protein product [Effrenium voratum]CAJ1372837.1 unnamed protein product [Effrenium voratum]CAJ1441025.1 unnamed protein product [Effrenium voratum]|mmetsp:Transcript_98834/g.235628  ORF Transcript_98834/g.235628 Transcript_98834/m.235628 type:complete len:125 (-) Transcript_98834:32-406(-)